MNLFNHPLTAGVTELALSIADSENENRAKDRDWRHEQNQNPYIQVLRKGAVVSQRRAAHNALGEG